MFCDGADMSVEEEDKPKQQLAKLAEVAEVAAIRNEPHSTRATDLHPTHHQPQQPDTVQVRVSEAGVAEVDPLQNHHPADLDTPAGPAGPADSASVGTWGAAQGDQRQPMHGADEGSTSCRARMEYGHRREHAPPQASDMPKGDVHSAGLSKACGLQVKDEDDGAVLGFQMGDADMADAEENVDIGAYVKAEQAMSQQASGSSGSENGQAVLMDLDAQGRQPSPASRAKPAPLG